MIRFVLRWLLLLSLAPMCIAGARRGRTDDELAFTVTVQLAGGGSVDLRFETEPAMTNCQPAASEDGRQRWNCSDYTLSVSARSESAVSSIQFVLESATGKEFKLLRYGARAVARYTKGDGVWSYNHFPRRGIRDTTPIDRPFEADTSPNRGIPLVVMFDSTGKNRLALGLLSQNRLVELRGSLDAETETYSISADQVETLTTARQTDTFYLSQASDGWFQVAQDYARQVDLDRKYVPLRIPATAYNSTYDPWYWTADSINQEIVWNLATLASNLGFKSYFIDAGWDALPGNYFAFPDGHTGDYRPPPETFPDFAGLIEQIRSRLGMRVMLWLQQYALGRDSVYYPALSNSLSYALDAEGDPVELGALCPRVSSTYNHLSALFERVLRDYRPDALWLDWQENIPAKCSAPHSHDYATLGDGYGANQNKVVQAIRLEELDAFVEMRWPFANLYNKPYSHLWQPFDSPNDFETMRLQAMGMRAFSRGVAMGTEEMYWNPTVSDTEAARYMATVVFTGVPYFGQNLSREPEYRLRMVKSWLDFYEAHKTELTAGRFSPYGDVNHPDQVIENASATFVYYGHPSNSTLALTARPEQLFVVNASSSESLRLDLSGLDTGEYQVWTTNLLLERQLIQSTQWFEKTRARLDYEVPVGGLLILTRKRT